MFLSNGASKDTWVYEFGITIFEGAEEKFRGIRTNLITTFSRSITTTYESVKIELIKKNADLPNPATYAVESERSYPLQETLLPIAKRSLVKVVSAE